MEWSGWGFLALVSLLMELQPGEVGISWYLDIEPQALG